MLFLGTKHITTTSFHPQSYGILEIVHRQLKDALRMQSNPINWYNNLPQVLPSIRSAIKEELNCSSSEIVYGQTLRLSQDHPISLKISTETNQFVFRLKEHFWKLQAPPTRTHFNKSYVDLHLKLCKRVLIRNNHMQHSLATRYNGPYEVLNRYQKYLIVLVDGRQKIISIDRPKACQEEDDADDIVETVRTRSGREIRRPKQYQI